MKIFTFHYILTSYLIVLATGPKRHIEKYDFHKFQYLIRSEDISMVHNLVNYITWYMQRWFFVDVSSLIKTYKQGPPSPRWRRRYGSRITHDQFISCIQQKFVVLTRVPYNVYSIEISYPAISSLVTFTLDARFWFSEHFRHFWG